MTSNDIASSYLSESRPGTIYTGEVNSHGIPHGHGVAIYSYGDSYVGDWKDGVWHGNGVHTLSDGSNYEGGYVNDLRHGHGVLKDATTGASYTGEWCDDLRHGRGFCVHPTVGIYDGKYANGEPHGRGRSITPPPNSSQCTSFFNIEAVNKTTGCIETWSVHPLASFRTTLHPHYGTASNLRFQLKGKYLFFSSCAKKTMDQLGFQEGDTLMIEEVATVPCDSLKSQRKSSDIVALNISDVKIAHKPSSKNKRSQVLQTPPKDYKEEHSIMLTKVFDEAYPIFQKLRQELNASALKRSEPGNRISKFKAADIQIENMGLTSTGLQLEGKAGKSTYHVLVGDPNQLYCSRKKSRKSNKHTQVIDLHGYSSKEAVKLLDSSLPKLVEEAMAEHQVIPVDIVCGCGSQTLSEVVQKWIKRNNSVANRRKSF